VGGSGKRKSFEGTGAGRGFSLHTGPCSAIGWAHPKSSSIFRVKSVKAKIKGEVLLKPEVVMKNVHVRESPDVSRA